MSRPTDGPQARLGAQEGVPLAEQLDAIAPAFKLLAVFQCPMGSRPETCPGNPAIICPDEERREGIKYELSFWETLE